MGGYSAHKCPCMPNHSCSLLQRTRVPKAVAISEALDEFFTQKHRYSTVPTANTLVWLWFQVRLQGCAFDGNSVELPLLLADNRGYDGVGVFYDDAATPDVCSMEGAALDVWGMSSDCEMTRPLALKEPHMTAVGPAFLTREHPWLLRVLELRQKLSSSHNAFIKSVRVCCTTQSCCRLSVQARVQFQCTVSNICSSWER